MLTFALFTLALVAGSVSAESSPNAYRRQQRSGFGARSSPKRLERRATSTASTATWTNQGCVNDGSARLLANEIYVGTANSADYCIALCAGAGYKYAGVEYGQQCYCGNTLNTVNTGLGLASSSSSCSYPCPANTAQSCGGFYYMNLWAAPATVSSSASASASSAPSGLTHLGCYTDSSTRLLPYIEQDSTTLTPTSCVAYCSAAGYKLAGMENGGQCWCGTSVGTATTIAASSCNSPCAGNSALTCGGSWALDVYSSASAAASSSSASSTSKSSSSSSSTSTSSSASASPTVSGAAHLGCYTDSSTRLLPYSEQDSTVLTPTWCLAHCTAAGYKFAGLENGGQCWCGSTIGSATTIAASSCNSPCAGNSGISCGGSYALDIYTSVSAASSSATPTSSSSSKSSSSSSSSSSKSSTSSSASASPSVSGAAHLGCYTDSSARLLPYSEQDSTVLTPTWCLAHCTAAGYKYAGLENGGQCWCGSTIGSATTIAASSCNSPCAGNSGISCGGSYALDIYTSVSASASATPTSSSSSSKSSSSSTASPTPPPSSSSSKSSSSSSSSSTSKSSSSSSSSTSTSSAYTLSSSSNAAATLVTGLAAPPAAATTKALYAHVIMGNTYNYGTTEWASEIAQAQAAGIDGFALNLGQGSYEITSTAALYSVAASVGFKAFFSFDMTSLTCVSASDGAYLASLVQQYAGSSAQAKYNGKVLVSSFAGDACYFGQGSVADGWNNEFRAPLSSSGISIYFVPAIFSDPSTFGSATWFDGELNWNSGWPMGSTDLTTASDTQYLADLGSKGYMAAVSPFFFTYYSPQTYNKDWIYRSDDWLLATRMEQLISMRNSFPFAELLTWNDFGESSYIGPIAIDSNQPNSAAWVDGFPHTALLSLISYYAPAFKTGAYGAVTDHLWMWSRPHSKNAVPSAPTLSKPSNWDYTDDKLYAIVTLTSPATVTITSGSNVATWYLNTGLNKLSLASAVGTITGKIVRNGVTVKSYDSSGSFTYVATPQDYNFNYFCAEA